MHFGLETHWHGIPGFILVKILRCWAEKFPTSYAYLHVKAAVTVSEFIDP